MRSKRPDPKVPDTASLLKVLQAIPIVKAGLFVVRASMGLRPAEARRLNVAEVRIGSRHDLADAALLLPAKKVKTRTPRLLELQPMRRLWLRHPEVEAALSPIDRRFGGEPLFPHLDGDDRRWKPSAERRLWLKAEKVAGATHVPPNRAGGTEDRNMSSISSLR